MLDTGYHHQNRLDERGLKHLLKYYEQEDIRTYAELLLNPRLPATEVQGLRAKLFDALLELDKSVYIRRRADLETIINPYK
jgi:hypothetical protein